MEAASGMFSMEGMRVEAVARSIVPRVLHAKIRSMAASDASRSSTHSIWALKTGRKSAATRNWITESLKMGKPERMASIAELETANTGQWQRRVRYSRNPCFCMNSTVAWSPFLRRSRQRFEKLTMRSLGDSGLETISSIDAARLSNMS